MTRGLQQVGPVDARGHHLDDDSTALNCDIWNFLPRQPRSGLGNDCMHVNNATSCETSS